jgi:hypothetical protein
MWLSRVVAICVVAAAATLGGCGSSGHSGAGAPAPSQSPSSGGSRASTGGGTPAGYACVKTSLKGLCGPYEYSPVTGPPHNPYVGQNVWGPIEGETQTLSANDPGDWEVVNRTAAGNTAVTAFPNTGVYFDEAPLSSFSTIVGSFSETMPHTPGTSAWAAYDNWFDDWKYEVMIQHDFVGAGGCDYVAVATFGGSNGVPSRLWGLCKYGEELIWKLAAPGSTVGTQKTANESSGSVDIKAMTTWLVDHGYIAADPTITNLSYGWEICSTNGVDQTFTVSHYSLTATPVS